MPHMPPIGGRITVLHDLLSERGTIRPHWQGVRSSIWLNENWCRGASSGPSR